MVAIKALACELPSRRGLPLARWSVADLRQEAVASGIVARISGTTLWRWLGQDALRPWRHRSWIFPRDPHFARRAGQVIDLYQRRWKGAALGPHDYVLLVAGFRLCRSVADVNDQLRTLDHRVDVMNV